jgi:transaldolase/glucose-6-phosphate isomerase
MRPVKATSLNFSSISLKPENALISVKPDPSGKKLYRLDLGEYEDRITQRLVRWREKDFLQRLWRKDPALWSSEAVPEISDRLGWLFLPETMEERLPSIYKASEELRTERVEQVVLIGMGGSSLAPEIFQSVFSNAMGFPRLVVLDSTHPEAVMRLQKTLDIRKTFFLISSKSGTTLETISLFRYFWSLVQKSIPSPGSRFAAITDPATPLAQVAEERDFRFLFRAVSDVGGRYSAFTEFGMVPAALIGVDIENLLSRVRYAVESNASSMPVDRSPGLIIGAAIGELNPDRDKLTLMTSPSLHKYPDWLEQLIAESTGKDGKGVLPVKNEPSAATLPASDERLFVYTKLEKDRDHKEQKAIESLVEAGHPVIQCVYRDVYDLGYDMFTWELAVSAAGSILGVHPFNQPDVSRSKELASASMSGETDAGKIRDYMLTLDEPESMANSLNAFLDKSKCHDYIGLQAFLAPTQEIKSSLEDVCLELSDKTGMVTTQGFGPRYLHSTGQIHKGGPNKGLFIQLLDEPETDLSIPETSFTFGSVLNAQAEGDYQALNQLDRGVIRVNLGRNVLGGLEALKGIIQRF